MKTPSSPFYIALQPSLALRQIATVVLIMAFWMANSEAKPHTKSHKPMARQAATHGLAYGKTKEAMALADELAEQHKLPKFWVREQISKAQHLKGVP